MNRAPCTRYPANKTADFAALRRQSIGASEAAAAVGLSPWLSPWMLGQIKAGNATTNTSPAMEWGNRLEPVIADKYETETGLKIRDRQGKYHSRIWPFAVATIDGRINRRLLVEIKTARDASDWGRDCRTIPIHYEIQTQHQMAVTGAEAVDVAVLFAGRDFRIYHVPRNDTAITQLLDKEGAWWDAYRAGRLDDFDKTPADYSTAWATARPGSTALATAENVAAWEELKKLRQLTDELETRQAILTGTLKAKLEDAEILTDRAGRVLATWKNTADRQQFQLDQLRHDYPELAAHYTLTVPGSRRFLLKD